MPKPIVASSDVNEILDAVAAKLVEDEVAGVDCVYVVADDNPNVAQATRAVRIWPQDFVDDKPVTLGAGRNAMHMTEPFWVQCLVSLQTDEYDRANKALTDPLLGLNALRNACVNSLHHFWPTDADGNAIAIRPIRLLNGRRGRKPPAPRNGLWTECSVVFEVAYRLTLDLTRQ